jgi:two-component system response regulator PilR (NtrC family)/two-component system response regulator HydG
MKSEERNNLSDSLLKEIAYLRKRVAELEVSKSKHKETEKKLRKSEHMYRALVKASPDAVTISSLDGDILEVSQRTLELFGYERKDELLGKSGLIVIASEDHDKVKKAMGEVLKKGYAENLEFTWIKKNGTRFYGESAAALLNDSQGNPKAIISTTRDITERKHTQGKLEKSKKELELKIDVRTVELERANQALRKELKERRKTEKALRESEQMYKNLLKTSPDYAAVSDLEGNIIELSESTLKYLGLENEDEIIGKSGFKYIAPEDREKARIAMEKVFKEGTVRNMEFIWQRKDGSRFIAESNATLIKDAEGRPKAILHTTRDITDRKKAEQTLRESEELYKKLLKTSPDLVALSNLEGTIIDASQRTSELLRYKNPNGIIGEDGFNLIALEDHEKVRLTMQKLLTEGFASNVEFIIMRKDGTRFIGEANATLLKDAQGKPKAFLYTIRDITQRKKVEKELTQEVKKLRKQIQQRKPYPEIIGSSPNILKVIELMKQVARTNSTVLIYGETGSGKDLIAHAIHRNSPRKDAPFLTINCAALPEQLIESELFGYVKGAFTGANQDKRGLFEEADKGTIFLNEIGEIPIKLQPKLLEVLERHYVRRLGDNKSVNVDVRIIAATNKDLKEEIKKHQFREDLFYRLNVLPITIPPLRERKEDIPLLVKHFLDDYCPSMNKNIENITQGAMDILCNYSYPGNVRELENIIQRSLLMIQGSTLLEQHLPEELKEITPITAPEHLSESVADTEKKMIETMIEKCGGNLTRTAHKLGISRVTLWRKIKKLKIDVSDIVT